MTTDSTAAAATPGGHAPDDESSHEVAVSVARAADAKKADEVMVLDVGPIIGICDYFVVCSAPNSRLVGAIAQEIEDRIADEYGRRPISVEGLDDRRWVLVDYGDVVVHVFADAERTYYRRERLYGDAERVAWQPAAVGDPA